MSSLWNEQKIVELNRISYPPQSHHNLLPLIPPQFPKFPIRLSSNIPNPTRSNFPFSYPQSKTRPGQISPSNSSFFSPCNFPPPLKSIHPKQTRPGQISTKNPPPKSPVIFHPRCKFPSQNISSQKSNLANKPPKFPKSTKQPPFFQKKSEPLIYP